MAVPGAVVDGVRVVRHQWGPTCPVPEVGSLGFDRADNFIAAVHGDGPLHDTGVVPAPPRCGGAIRSFAAVGGIAEFPGHRVTFGVGA